MSFPAPPWWADGYAPTDDPTALPVLVASLKSHEACHGIRPSVAVELAPAYCLQDTTGLRAASYGPIDGWAWRATWTPPYQDHGGTWRWEVDDIAGTYRDPYAVGLHKAERMHKTLRRIANALQAKERKEGPADRPALWVPRLCVALRIPRVLLRRCSTPEPDVRPWSDRDDLNALRSPVEAGTHLEHLAQEVRTVRLPTTKSTADAPAT